LEAWKLTEEQFWEEVKFVEKLHQGYYDQNPETPVMCHNDIHGGNVMRNREGELNPDEIILVDFDAAQYGYRMWDIVEWIIFSPGHNFLYFSENLARLSEEKINQILLDYLNTQTYDENLTLKTLQTELLYMKPYAMLQRLTFKVGFFGKMDEEFNNFMRELYNSAIAPFNRTLPEPSI